MRRLVVVLLGAGVVAVGGIVLVTLVGRPSEPPAAPSQPASTPLPKPSATPTPRPEAVSPKPSAPPPAAARAEPTTGTLVIESDVPDTSVFVDRVYLGDAPVTAVNLTPGPHRINASAKGYEGFVETVDVTPGTRTLTFRFKEIRLDERVEVTHKHAFGSCRGALVATPSGLTYEATNAGDRFAVSLEALETFEMDYVAKNLRVKIRDGKTYNFTTPKEGDKADALYLFHQAVEKVRERLRSGR